MSEPAADSAISRPQPDLRVPVLSERNGRSWPKHAQGMRASYLPLGDALSSTFATDAHFAAYSAPDVKRRLGTQVLTDAAAREVFPDGIRMVLAVFDVDDSSHRANGGDGTPNATDDWWEEEITKIERLRSAHPGAYIYRTRGGYRIVFVLAPAIVVKEPADADAWTLRYVTWVAYLARAFEIHADAACKDFVRLFRLPHSTRDGGSSPEMRSTIGDEAAIGEWTCEPDPADHAAASKLVTVKARTRRKRREAARGDRRPNAPAGVLYHAFERRGWIGSDIETGKWAVRCPNENAHSGGEPFDTSTVLFAPESGDVMGHVHCSHAHCVGRTLGDVLAAFSEEELTGARAAMLAGGDARPVIVVRNELVRVTDAAAAALASYSQAGLFVRGGVLVRVGRDGVDRKRWVRHSPGAPIIAAVTPAYLREVMDRSARWTKSTGADGALIAALPPEWAVKSLFDRGEWPLPPLADVSETPVLRRDGTIFETRGYDPDSFALFDPAIQFPSVPRDPTKKDVQQALALILDVIHDFPFVSGCARAAAVALLLSIVARSAIEGPVPVFAIRAPTPGSGKTLLALVLVLAAIGRVPAMMAVPKDGEELKKILLALGLAGDRVVLIDNADGVVGSDTLAMAVTATYFQGRLLGVNRTITVPLRPVWIVTGNNTRFRATLGRRIVPIDLDAACENPEDRTGFRHAELVRHVEASKAQLIVAALTIVRAFFVAGSPRHGGSRMGSYEHWDDIVRSCCIWLEIGDPAATDDPNVGRGRLRAEGDDDVEAASAMLGELNRAYHGDSFTTPGVVGLLAEDERLRNALAGVVRGGGANLTPRAIGAAFKKYRDRVVGGLRLVCDGKARGGYAQWRVTGESPSRWEDPGVGDHRPLDRGRRGWDGESPETHPRGGGVDDAPTHSDLRHAGAGPHLPGRDGDRCRQCGAPPRFSECALHPARPAGIRRVREHHASRAGDDRELRVAADLATGSHRASWARAIAVAATTDAVRHRRGTAEAKRALDAAARSGFDPNAVRTCVKCIQFLRRSDLLRVAEGRALPVGVAAKTVTNRLAADDHERPLLEKFHDRAVVAASGRHPRADVAGRGLALSAAKTADDDWRRPGDLWMSPSFDPRLGRNLQHRRAGHAALRTSWSGSDRRAA